MKKEMLAANQMVENIEHIHSGLAQAIVHYQKAITACDLKKNPSLHKCKARIFNNLGLAYLRLASVCDERVNILRAIEAYEEALAIRTKESHLLKYLMLQKSLGDSYYALARIEHTLAYLSRASRYYQHFFEIEKRIGDYGYLRNVIEDAKTKFSEVQYCLE